MHATKVEPRVPEGNHMRVILKILAESIRQARKAMHTHFHVVALPLNVRSRDVLGVRVWLSFFIHLNGTETDTG